MVYVNFGSPLIVFDTETGGLCPRDQFDLPRQHKLIPGDKVPVRFIAPAAPILEIGACRLDPITLKELDYFHSYCGPDEGETVDQLLARCDRKALEVNGLDKKKAELASAPTCKEVLKKFIYWATDKTGKFKPAGQNVRFDIDMVNMWCWVYGIDFEIQESPQELKCLAEVYFALPDTPVVANYKLGTVAEALGINTERAHEALYDVRMTAECLRKIYSRFSA